MKKIIILLVIFCVITVTAVSADSATFDTMINTVTPGYGEIGYGLFPVATCFQYDKDNLTLIKDYKHKANVSLESQFYLENTSMDYTYAYDTGRPKWYLTKKEQENYKYKSGEYFNPNAYIDFYLAQPYGTNPISKGGSLGTLYIGLNTHFSLGLESLGTSSTGKGFLFVDDKGNTVTPFDSYVSAFPWLSGKRQVLTNYLYLESSFNFNESTGRDAYDGAYASVSFEFGPSWLANTNSSGVMSNYWRASAYLEEKITLFNIRQDNDWNWFTGYFGHSNSFSYTGGDIIPQYKITSDRLRAYVSDRIWLHFAFPQFLVPDCYSYMEFSLYNTYYFGHVVNEVDQSTFAGEYASYFSAYYHLRLFGFVKFEYDLSYNFFRGIWPSFSSWNNKATLTFSVTL